MDPVGTKVDIWDALVIAWLGALLLTWDKELIFAWEFEEDAF